MKFRRITIAMLLAFIMTMLMAAPAFAEEQAAELEDNNIDTVEQAEEAVIEEVTVDGEVQPELTAEPAKKTVKKAYTPEGVKAKGISRSTIKISWKRAKNAKGYKIYQYSSKKHKYVLIKTIKSGKTTSYKVKGLRANRSKSFKVSSYTYADGKMKTSKKSKRVKAKTKPRTIKVKAYAYSGGGYTASGRKAKEGVIAVDPRKIKLGTKVYIPGYGKAVAADTGGNIKGNVIDVYMSTNKKCCRWGVRYVTIKIYD